MRTCLVLLLALLACKRDREAAPQAPPSAASPRDADALWSLAPPGASLAIVATPRALQHADGALAALRELLAADPALAPLRGLVDDALGEVSQTGDTRFAALGIDTGKGAALFVTRDGPVVVVPIGDRAKLHRTLQLPDAGAGRLGPLACKDAGAAHVCAPRIELLDGLGQAHVPSAIATLGARGDVELVASEGPLGVAVVAQLERGSVTVRGTAATPLPAGALGAPAIPRVTPGTTAAFALGDLRALFARLPELVLAHGVTTRLLADSLGGPMTVTIATGATVPDVRIPLKDPGPASELVEHCADFVPADMLVAGAPDDTCRLTVPGYGLTVDLWVQGKEGRVGSRRGAPGGTPPDAPQVPLTALGEELARKPWSLAMWGRGTLFGARDASTLPAGAPSQQAMMLRAFTLLQELGLGVRHEQGRVAFVLGVRTIWANPPEVVAKLFAIPTTDLLEGKPDAALAIARAYPRSPFAADVAAGQGGLMIPTAVIGMLAAVAVPAFMDYMKKSKVSEAVLQLNRIAKAAKIVVASDGKLPAGMAALTPATDCCATGGRCEPSAAAWGHPVWRALDFALTQPHLFRYSYASDGDSFTATAVGDLDCDGDAITYTLAGTIRDGQLEVTLVEPPPNTD